MDKNIVLQVSMGEDDSLQIMMGDSVPSIVLVGLLEQVKLELLSGSKDQMIKASKKEYDA